MSEQLKNRVRELLASGEAEGFLGLVEADGHPLPRLITRDNLADVEKLTVGEIRYPLAGILTRISRVHPEARLAVMVRGCEERALIEIYKSEQLRPAQVVPVGINCPEALARKCRCPRPFTSFPGEGEKTAGVNDRSDIAEIEAMSESARLEFWRKAFSSCIRCYGCRNICPMCFCQNCTLGDDKFLGKGEIPPANPGWHLLRAFHLAGRCIDCGLCEEACPMGIPLRRLYRRVREAGEEIFGYLPGADPEARPPFEFLDDGKFEIPKKDQR